MLNHLAFRDLRLPRLGAMGGGGGYPAPAFVREPATGCFTRVSPEGTFAAPVVVQYDYDNFCFRRVA